MAVDYPLFKLQGRPLREGAEWRDMKSISRAALPVYRHLSAVKALRTRELKMNKHRTTPWEFRIMHVMPYWTEIPDA